MPSCAIITCKNRSDLINCDTNSISFHRFPRDREIKEKWIAATCRGPLWLPVIWSTICSIHFAENQFRPLPKGRTRRRLVDRAVPTLKLPQKLKTSSQTQESAPEANDSTETLKKSSSHSQPMTEIDSNKTTVSGTVNTPAKMDMVMSETETPDGRTIQYYIYRQELWNAVLDYVPLEDILRMQTVSRDWRRMVLTYLQDIRIGIKPPPLYWKSVRFNSSKLCFFDKGVKENRFLMMRVSGAAASFERLINNMGRSIRTAYCDSEDSCKMLGKCPNLENLMIIKLPEKMRLNDISENWKSLKRLHFENCARMSDEYIRPFFVNNTVEELGIRGNLMLTGEFLIHKDSLKLKSLSMDSCSSLKAEDLIAASACLSQLTKIELIDYPNKLCDIIHLVLENTPKLEHVKITGSDAMSENSDNVFKAICRMKNLKYLCVDFFITDEHIHSVTQSCQQLQYLYVSACIGVTGPGLVAACGRMGGRLLELGIEDCRRVYDDHLVDCVRACPSLKVLAVRDCRNASDALRGRVTKARREMGVRHAFKFYNTKFLC